MYWFNWKYLQYCSWYDELPLDSIRKGTITAGGGTTNNSVTVTWGAAGTGHVTLNYTNGSGCTAAAATDQAITINALPTPAITGSTTLCAGSTGNVYTTAGGMSNYQWTVTGGTVAGGGTTSDNSVTVTWGASGTGHVILNYTNGNGCTAASATNQSITINALPAITVHPADITIFAAENTSFSVTATGTAITYQWYENQGLGWNSLSNSGVYSNVTTATMNITAATLSMNGYQYRCEVSGTCTPAAVSNAALLTVNTTATVEINGFDYHLCR